MNAPATIVEGLTRVQQAQVLLDKATTVVEVREVRAKAAAAMTYFRGHDRALDGVVDAAAVKLRAERKLGDLLRDEQKNTGGRPAKKTSNLKLLVTPPTLESRGISKMEASRWQRLADIPEDLFGGYLKKCGNKHRVPTVAGALALVVTIQPEPAIKAVIEPTQETLEKLGVPKKVIDDCCEHGVLLKEVFRSEFILRLAPDLEPRIKDGSLDLDGAEAEIRRRMSGVTLGSTLNTLRTQRESDPDYSANRALEKELRGKLGVSRASTIIDFALRGGELALARLRLDYESTLDNLKKAYRERSLRVHPDRGGSQDEMATLNADHELVKSYIEQVSQ